MATKKVFIVVYRKCNKYIMIPPNKAQVMYMKLEENPWGKIWFVLWWFCSVTEILKMKLEQHFRKFYEIKCT